MVIGIVIVNWNGWKDTIDCLDSLAALTLRDNEKVHIVVVDNASADGSVNKLEQYILSSKLNVKLVREAQNLGFTGGNNAGIEILLKTGADYILLLNNDTVVSPSFLSRLMASSRKTHATVVGPKIYFSAGFEFHKKYTATELGKVIWYAGGIIDWDNMYCSHRGVDEVDHGQYDKAEETPFVTGCCMLVKRKVFETVGLLDNNYFAYLEDVDFCMRAKRAGFILQYEPLAVIWHKNAQSSGKPGSDVHLYYQTRNRLMFGMNYAPFSTKAALLRESVRLLKRSPSIRQGVLDFYLHRYGRKTP